MGFTILLTQLGLLSRSIVSLPLNQQRRGTQSLDIVSNLMDETKNYLLALAAKIKPNTILLKAQK